MPTKCFPLLQSFLLFVPHIAPAANPKIINTMRDFFVPKNLENRAKKGPYKKRPLMQRYHLRISVITFNSPLSDEIIDMKGFAY